MSSIAQSAPSRASLWIAVRRPLLLIVLLGCAMSLMTSGRLTLRIALPAALCWSFVPLLEIGALKFVCGRELSPHLIDRFFQDQWPWLLWLTGFSVLWGLAPTAFVIGHTAYPTVWYVLAVAAGAWSLRLDYLFSRRVLGRSGRDAARDVVLERLICWPAALAIFLLPSAWQVVASELGL